MNESQIASGYARNFKGWRRSSRSRKMQGTESRKWDVSSRSKVSRSERWVTPELSNGYKGAVSLKQSCSQNVAPTNN